MNSINTEIERLTDRADIKDSAWNTDDEVRAALDAAIKAQKEVQLDGYAYHAPSYERGRTDALEEAAKIADEQADEPDSKFPSDTARMIATAIRKLKGL